MTHHEYIIIGAGPAGLQMGYYLGKAKRDYIILEGKDTAGSFFATQPRHRTLLSINKRFNLFPEAEFNMRHDWNSLLTDDYSHLFKDYSEELYPHADDLYRYLQDFAKKYALNICYNTRVATIDREGEGDKNFILTDANGKQWSCTRLLMATGAVAPYVPEEIEGIELADSYEDHNLDPTHYQNKRVLVIGRGNSAFEVANHLAAHAGIVYISTNNNLLKHAWQTHFVGDLRAINNTVLDMYQLKSLHLTLGLSVTKITKRDDGTFYINYKEELPHWEKPGVIKSSFVFDHVIHCTGWKFVDSLPFTPAVKPHVDKKEKYPVLSSSWESSTPDMFFIGVAMGARDRKSASSFIHGFRYNVRTLFHLLEERYYDVPLPSQTFKLENGEDLETFVEALVKRLSLSSALYQLFEFMGDVIVLSPGKAELFYELPVDYVLENEQFTTDKEIITMTLEYGFKNYPADASTLDFIHFPADSSCSAYIHAVFRHYKNGELLKKLPLDETLFVRYDVTLSEDLDNASSNQLLLNFMSEISNITTPILPVPTYTLDYTPWAEGEGRDPGIPKCLEKETTLFYTPTNMEEN